MDRAFAVGAVDSGLIPCRAKQETLKLVFTASLLEVQHERDSAKNKSVKFACYFGIEG